MGGFRRMLYGVGGLTPPEARLLSMSEAVEVLSARSDVNPLLVLAGAFKDSAPEPTESDETAVDRHNARLERERAATSG